MDLPARTLALALHHAEVHVEHARVLANRATIVSCDWGLTLSTCACVSVLYKFYPQQDLGEACDVV